MYACVYVCVVGDQVLLVSSSRHPDQWIVPGGGMEPEEEPGGTAVREVYEEVSHQSFQFNHKKRMISSKCPVTCINSCDMLAKAFPFISLNLSLPVQITFPCLLLCVNVIVM